MSNYSDSETPSSHATSKYRLQPPPHQQVQRGQAHPPPLPGFYHGSSPHANVNFATSVGPTSSATTTSKVASTNNYPFYGYSIDQYHHVHSPYFCPPPPPLPPPLPPPDSWTVSPNNSVARNESSSTSSTIYQHSPYFSDAPHLLGSGSGGSSESSTSSTMATVCRPVPAKSAFMCFSEAKSKAIREKMGPHTKGGPVETVAAEWRKLPPKSRVHWEEMAKAEKKRFSNERDALCKTHKGPLARKIRAKKNPLAPRRPMSAFLMYAQQKRRSLQSENPDIPNNDISRLLGEIWRNASPSEKRPHMEREEVERKLYKAKVEKWKNDEKLEKAMKHLTPRSHEVTTPGAIVAMERNDGDPRKLDRRQDVASSMRDGEESYSRFDSGQSSLLSSTSNPTNGYWCHQESPENNQYHQYYHADINTPYEYRYDSSFWAALPPTPVTATTTATARALHALKGEEEESSSARVVHYSYPRPPE